MTTYIALFNLTDAGIKAAKGIDTGTLAGFGPAAMMANDNNLIRSSPIPA